MAQVRIPKNFEDELLDKDLRKFSLMAILKNELSVLEILMLNDIINRYSDLSDIETDRGIFKIYNYMNIIDKFGSFYEYDSVLSTAKSRLVKKGFIEEKRGQFHCEKLGYCRLAVKLNNKKIKEIMFK